MMPQVIAYAVAVAALLSAVGLCVEQVLGRWGLPRRTAWCCAMLVSTLFPLLMMSRAHPVPVPASAPVAVAIRPSAAAAPLATVEPRTRPAPVSGRAPVAAAAPAPVAVPVGVSSASTSLPKSLPSVPAATPAMHWHPPLPSDRLIFALWMAASSLLLLYVTGASAVLHYRASAWRRESVMGQEVLVSADTGPALLGALRPRIVVPRWYLEEPAPTRLLIMQHEQQHVAGRDPLLLWAAVLVVMALPWNLPLWWQLRRLRLAIELDCDARVLREGADAGSYGEVLLAVTRRAAGMRGVSIAMGRPTSALERRIRNLVRVSPRHAGLRTAVSLLVAVTGAAAAAMLKAPVMPGVSAGAGSQAAAGSALTAQQRESVAAVSAAPALQSAAPARSLQVAATPPATGATAPASSNRKTRANPLDCLDPDVLHGLLLPFQALSVSTVVPPELATFKAPRELRWVAAAEHGYGASTQGSSAARTAVSAVYRSSLPPEAARGAASAALVAGGWKLQSDDRPGIPDVFVSLNNASIGGEMYCREGKPVNLAEGAVDGVTYVTLSVTRNPATANGFRNACEQPPRPAVRSTAAYDGYLPKLEAPRDPATGQPAPMLTGGWSGGNGETIGRSNASVMVTDSPADVARQFASQMARQGWSADASWSGQGTAGSTWIRKVDADTTLQATLTVSAFDEGWFNVVFSAVRTK